MLEKHMQEIPDIEHADADVVERFENKFKVCSSFQVKALIHVFSQ